MKFSTDLLNSEEIQSQQKLYLDMSFDRLIRFRDRAGIERYGNVEDKVAPSELEGKTVRLVSGDIESGFRMQDEKAEVAKVSR